MLKNATLIFGLQWIDNNDTELVNTVVVCPVVDDVDKVSLTYKLIYLSLCWLMMDGYFYKSDNITLCEPLRQAKYNHTSNNIMPS